MDNTTTPPTPPAARAQNLYDLYRTMGYDHADSDTYAFRDLQQRYGLSVADAWEAMRNVTAVTNDPAKV